MQIRNSLLILSKIKDHFPVWKKIGLALLEAVSKLENDERDDIKMMAKRFNLFSIITFVFEIILVQQFFFFLV